MELLNTVLKKIPVLMVLGNLVISLILVVDLSYLLVILGICRKMILVHYLFTKLVKLDKNGYLMVKI